MSRLEEISSGTRKVINDIYNEEPVYYCKSCLSLKIKQVTVDNQNFTNYCDKCGSTNVGCCDIEEWEKLYNNKYNKEIVKQNK
jgi:Zn finger protein HypA/HybF involved in hydrogenase expression